MRHAKQKHSALLGARSPAPCNAGCPFGRHAPFVCFPVGLLAHAVATTVVGQSTRLLVPFFGTSNLVDCPNPTMLAVHILPSRESLPNDRPFSRRMRTCAYSVGPRPGFSPGSLVKPRRLTADKTCVLPEGGRQSRRTPCTRCPIARADR